MNTQPTDSEPSEDETTEESIGVDGRGARHVYEAATRTIRVYTSTGNLEHEEELNHRPVADWIEYVAEQRGWRQRRFLTARDLFNDR